LWYAWKYFSEPSGKAKKIGSAALILTILSIALTLWGTQAAMKSLAQTLDSVNADNL
jgi:hypothetical protein